jgi:hypothetical protein
LIHQAVSELVRPGQHVEAADYQHFVDVTIANEAFSDPEDDVG